MCGMLAVPVHSWRILFLVTFSSKQKPIKPPPRFPALLCTLFAPPSFLLLNFIRLSVHSRCLSERQPREEEEASQIPPVEESDQICAIALRVTLNFYEKSIVKPPKYTRLLMKYSLEILLQFPLYRLT